MNSNNRFKAGNIALITGASSGIGKVFATKLGSLGLNLILIARRLNLLESIKKEIEREHHVEVQVFSADLSKSNWRKDIEGVENFKVDVLINNAGTGYPGEFGTKDFIFDRDLLQLNCMTPMELAHMYLPLMKKNQEGGIIFVSSIMGLHGIPYMAQYSATKSYLLNLGESLYTECRKYNVAIEVLLPGATKTPGTQLYDIEYDKLPIAWMLPEEVVDIAIEHFGKRALVIPGALNKLTSSLSTCLLTRIEVQKIMKKFADKVIRKATNNG